MGNNNRNPTQEKASVTYKGWIPNVAGRLSFSVFGYTNDPTRAIVENVADAQDRFIICYQKRVLADGVLPLKAVTSELFFNLKGKFWFVCVAHGDDRPSSSDSALQGYLFLFHQKDRWNNVAKQPVRDAQSQLRRYKSEGLSTPLDQHCEDLYNRLVSNLRKTASFHCTFSVCRDGETVLVPPTLDSLPEHSPTFPPNPKHRQMMLRGVLSQMFFFLRDVGHIHQHHNPKTDTIIDVHECRNGDDYSWRCETLRCLYRKALEYKRVKRDETFSSSLGVLAYAKSFERSSSRKLKAQQFQYPLEPAVYSDCLMDSIRANQAAVASRYADQLRRFEVNRNTLLAILTILFALVGMIKISNVDQSQLARPSIVLIQLANLLIKHPVEILAFTVAGVFFFLNHLGLIDIADFRIFRALTKLMQVMRKRTAALISIIIGIAIGAATGYFLASQFLAEAARIIW